MTSRRKQTKNNKSFLQFQLRSEGEALKLGTIRRQRRSARKQIRREDASLASALTNISVADQSPTDHMLSNNTKHPPVLGTPVLSLDQDVSMNNREKSGRVRKPCKKCRERRAKLIKRLSKRTAMSGITPSSSSSTPSPSTTKSVRFKLEPTTSN